MSKLNYFRSFLALPRIAPPLLFLMTLAVQELSIQAIASSSFPSAMQPGETSGNNPTETFSAVPVTIPDLRLSESRDTNTLAKHGHSASRYAIAPPETIEASPFSHPANKIEQAQASQRFLEVKRVRGKVTYSLGTEERPIQVGDRFSGGEGELITGKDSNIDLEIDNQIGLVEVSENSTVQIKTLSGSSDENSETVLFVSRGHVRLSLRSIRPASSDVSEVKTPIGSTQELLLARTLSRAGETLIDTGKAPLLAQRRTRRSNRRYPVRVETPAGIAGVRGTSFGVNVGPDGKTGIEIIKGSIAAIAQEEEVIFQEGQSVVMVPGESPTPPRSWQSSELATLRIRSLVRTSSYTAQVSGQVGPADTVFVNDKPIQTDSEGKFDAVVALPASRRLDVVVRGPAVRVRSYTISVP